MVITAVIIIAIVVAAIWLLFGFKRMKHRFLAIFLIVLFLFAFFSINSAFSGKNISLNNASDLGNIAKLYFSWLGTAFGNFKTLTAQVVKMNWEGNVTT